MNIVKSTQPIISETANTHEFANFTDELDTYLGTYRLSFFSAETLASNANHQYRAQSDALYVAGSRHQDNLAIVTDDKEKLIREISEKLEIANEEIIFKEPPPPEKPLEMTLIDPETIIGNSEQSVTQEFPKSEEIEKPRETTNPKPKEQPQEADKPEPIQRERQLERERARQRSRGGRGR